MPYNNLKVTITAAQMTSIKTSIDSINTILNFMVNLSKVEKKRLFRLGGKEIQFLEVSQQIATNNAVYFPPWLSVADFNQDVALMKNLKQIQRWLVPLNEGLDDTYWVANQEALATALTQYKNIQQAAKANQPVADELNKNLKKTFPKKPRKKKDNPD